MLTERPFLTGPVLCLSMTGLFFCMSSSMSYSSPLPPSAVLLRTETGLFVVICPYRMAMVAPRPNMPRACLRPNFDPYRTVPNARGMCSASMPGPLSRTVRTYGFGSRRSPSTALMVRCMSGSMPLWSHASRPFSTNSLTAVYRDRVGLLNPARSLLR